jgi:hypothetical protein
MNFCANCGAKLATEMKFCPSCGFQATGDKSHEKYEPRDEPNIYSNTRSGGVTSPEMSAEWFMSLVISYWGRMKIPPETEYAKWSEKVQTFRALYGEEEFWPRALPEPPAPSLPFQDDLYLLVAPIGEIKKVNQQRLIDIHNFAVDGIRDELLAELSSSAKTVRVREGLSVPLEWDAHYRILHEHQPEVLIWLAVKNAFIGNPLAGEVLEWSPTNKKSRNRTQTTKLIGAAAVGAVAALLLG